ncbi:hypothetical protein DSECCO2_475700 [anaerobic digester metagenome]
MLNFVIKPIKAGFDSRGSMASFIISIPINNIPKPIITSAMFLTFFFFDERYNITPMPAINVASFVMFNETKNAVTVVPMLAPIIIPTA